MATHPSILAWEIPWTERTEEPGRLQSMGSQKSWVWLKWRNNNSEDMWSIFSYTYHHFCSRFGGFPGGAGGEEPACQCRRCKRHRFDPWVGKIPWRRKALPNPVFLPGDSLGQRSLAGYSPYGHKDLDMTEATKHTCMGAPRGYCTKWSQTEKDKYHMTSLICGIYF